MTQAIIDDRFGATRYLPALASPFGPESAGRRADEAGSRASRRNDFDDVIDIDPEESEASGRDEAALGYTRAGRSGFGNPGYRYQRDFFFNRSGPTGGDADPAFAAAIYARSGASVFQPFPLGASLDLSA